MLQGTVSIHLLYALSAHVNTEEPSWKSSTAVLWQIASITARLVVEGVIW
jgi:hypothetical protein